MPRRLAPAIVMLAAALTGCADSPEKAGPAAATSPGSTSASAGAVGSLPADVCGEIPPLATVVQLIGAKGRSVAEPTALGDRVICRVIAHPDPQSADFGLWRAGDGYATAEETFLADVGAALRQEAKTDQVHVATTIAPTQSGTKLGTSLVFVETEAIAWRPEADGLLRSVIVGLLVEAPRPAPAHEARARAVAVDLMNRWTVRLAGSLPGA